MRALTATAILAALATAATPVSSAFTARTGSSARFDAASTFAPRGLTAPVITGTAKEGAQLTATDGTWARGGTVTARQWLRCDAAGGACVEIAGATGVGRTLTAADAGRRLRIRVTQTNAGGSTTAASDATATVQALPAPQSQIAPSIGGNLAVGSTLTADPGTWANGPVTTTFRWWRCAQGTCTQVDTGPAYDLGGDDAGTTLKVDVTATNGGGSTTITTAATPVITRATYTQLLCADPHTGRGVAADGALPDGLTFSADIAQMRTTPAATRCASGVTQTGTRGIPLAANSAWSTSTPNAGAYLTYTAPADLEFAGAELYRYADPGSSKLAFDVNRSLTPTDSIPQPNDEHCSWNFGCGVVGSPAAPFGAPNLLRVGVSSPRNGFVVKLACYIPDSSWRCTTTGTEVLRLYGARVTLRDAATPKVTATTGPLATAAALSGPATLTLSATDAGAGIYRVRVKVDGTEVAARVVDPNGGACADADPTDADPYEFAVQRPCPATASTRTLTFDTSGWPPGQHRLRVLLEDAGRNTATISDRQVTIGG